jgi:predicted TIM-barrel fold metal-dependent hydrolase
MRTHPPEIGTMNHQHTGDCDTDGGTLTRRRLLGALAVLGGGALVAGAVPGTLAAAPVAKGVIDIHHHVAPTNWLGSGGTPDEARVFKGWSIAKTLEEMDRAGVATSYASLTVPGHRFDDPAAARRVARECNEYMANLRLQHPGRFGLFALVPMPNVADTLAEIAYAYDTLKADGIGFFTSYGDKHLGNVEFDPVFAELNRRNAVAFVHPSLGPCCGSLQPQLTTAMIEYGTDTTRAIAEYIFNGGTLKFPNVKVIWSHAGGTMPYLVQRFIGSGGERLQANVPNGFVAEAKKCYYDTAQIPSKGAMLALRAIVPTSQILYGTDYPYKDFGWTEQMLVDGAVFSDREMQGVYRDNAAAMLAHAGRPVPA